MIMRRLLAALVDYIILWIIILVYIFILNSFVWEIDENIAENVVYASVVTCVIFILLYVGLKDLLFKGSSIGKKMFGLKIYSMNEKFQVTKLQLIRRNLVVIFIIPFEFLLVCTGNRRYGDKLANTQVRSIN